MCKISYLHIGHPDLHFVQLVEDVCLGQTECSVSIQLTREPNHRHAKYLELELAQDDMSLNE